MVNLDDKYNRSFKTLRVSLLSTCNLGCIYCTMGSEDEIAHDHRPQTPAANFVKIIAGLHGQLNLKTIRLTGGEPLLYRELETVIKGITALGIADVRMTSNGFLLERMAPKLKAAGLRSVNVSLDAMDAETFFAVTRRKQLQRTLAGIEAAIACGLEVKINSVIMQGQNDKQILPLLNYAFKQNVPIRFLEVMAMGHLFGNSEKHLFTQHQILDVIASRYNFVRLARKTSATANYWQTEQGGIFGIIGNESEPFCQDCNRLRLDAEGNIYGCLSNNNPIPLNGNENNIELTGKLQQAMQQKQNLHFVGSALSMMHIGG
ncbi:cyclic pyranopterin phosphate synthase [Mucilaginibacter gracilis]|uniref:Cyclic pyranopterin phosphate synthase n=1 Tax=Mucilaginibacter gracilis TaxID=423350 RepID=A0A495J9T3_9SPHI|nr:GTP 3',8-cyclase MoaA [Mucilaginibacter gracilis]RKR84819.1 cyclic pyranopterin phosphate synthase [Mucilaginibacter gracilis]